ncbi:MAG: amidohydrolase [Ruminococcaceae bacterium]|nr:amidohydrolase [Oscillospiraceae bacterium]
MIDFHTHLFPEKIAARTIDYLSKKGGIPPFSDGTASGLIHSLERAKADIAVNLPVLTNPSQFESVNRFACEINEQYKNAERRIISFGGIHPLCEDIDGKMKQLKGMGFLGVKVHPDYQETPFNSDGYIRILQCAKEYDLIVVTHAGIDAGYRDRPVMCTPALAKEVIDKVGHGKLVLAHLGGYETVEQVFELLCGKDVYFDTAYVLRFIGEENFKKLLKLHGEDRILFASDSPWSDIDGDVKILKSFELGKETEDKLFCQNAKRLLGI